MRRFLHRPGLSRLGARLSLSRPGAVPSRSAVSRSTRAGASATPTPTPTPSKLPGRLVLLLSAVFLIPNYYARPSWVSGPSMSPTLSPGAATTGSHDWVLVRARRLPFRDVVHDVKRGDIVVFWSPHRVGDESVKRVVGLAGDTIIRDRRRVRKEVETQGRSARELGMRALPPVVKVPVGHCWVEGDNWRDSRDSNDFGPVSLSLVTGRVEGVVWPWERMGSSLEKREDREGTRVVRAKVVPLLDEGEEGVLTYRQFEG